MNFWAFVWTTVSYADLPWPRRIFQGLRETGLELSGRAHVPGHDVLRPTLTKRQGYFGDYVNTASEMCRRAVKP